MALLTIHDVKDHVLAFDLRDLLRALAPRALTADWTIAIPTQSAFEATGAGGLRLEELAEASARITGSDLLSIADDTQQVIWGDFVGILPDDPQRDWLTIRAFDSSFYEVETADETAIEAVKTHFRDVRIVARTN